VSVGGAQPIVSNGNNNNENKLNTDTTTRQQLCTTVRRRMQKESKGYGMPGGGQAVVESAESPLQ
jgi:hypothetical protein